MKLFFTVIPFLLVLSHSQAQNTLFDNEKALEFVKNGADMIYAMDRDSTYYYIEKTRKVLPNHPVVSMMEGVLILWQHIPVLEPEVFEEFKSKMLETASKAQDMGGEEPEGIFFELASRGLLAEYYADRGAYMKAIGEASRSYNLLKKGFDLTDDYPEFLFAAGIYNYFREAYPRRYPFIRPLIWFFRNGDIDKGISQIKEAARVGIISKVEAHMYLGYIFLRYEEEPEKAQEYMLALMNMYPENLYIKTKYIESLNLPGYYQKFPLSAIDSLMTSDRLYFKIVGNVFKGVYCEMVIENDNMAFDYYNQAIGMGEALQGHGDHYKSLAYLGAGRISRRSKKSKSAENYFRLAALHAQTREVLSEAENALNH